MEANPSYREVSLGASSWRTGTAAQRSNVLHPRGSEDIQSIQSNRLMVPSGWWASQFQLRHAKGKARLLRLLPSFLVAVRPLL
jgi:hypothetical protein